MTASLFALSSDAAAGDLRDLVEEALSAASGGEDEATAAALEALADELAARFSHEESLMRERAYPNHASHAAAHGAFLADLARTQSELARFGATPLVHRWLALRCGEWLLQHARMADAPLARYLAGGRGIAQAPSLPAVAPRRNVG